ncbi:uncharacterized protein PAC_04431 [Phialocephala subalpina]|uniref:Uncharacterized protein n=1 Tax=Phialocephala subalpina TaxID=576137 RepID=A0A1L7WP50_9HELO|nr:uncharacterized protein PAC_04431 [Phialocephala subalpina]
MKQRYTRNHLSRLHPFQHMQVLDRYQPALVTLITTQRSKKLSLFLKTFDKMPIMHPSRAVPDDERRDIGVPFAIHQMPNITPAEQFARMKARLQHYGVKGLFNRTFLAELEAQRVSHNGYIARAKQDIDNAIVVRDAQLGVVIGEYRYSDWVPWPRIIFDPHVPYRHVVKARHVGGTTAGRMKLFIANETLDGVSIGALPYEPLVVSHKDVVPLEEYQGEDGGLDTAAVLSAVSGTIES